MSSPGEEERVGQNYLYLMRRNLTKQEILRRKRDIDNLFRSGRRISVPGIKMVYTRNRLEFSRVFFTLVRKFGNSVQRNRAKRVFKEIYRIHKQSILPGWDIAFILFPGSYDFNDLGKQFDLLLKKTGLFSGDLNL